VTPLRRLLELRWPSLLVGALTAGIAASIWLAVSAAAVAGVAVCALVGFVAARAGVVRLAALGIALAALGLAWGSLRMDALRESTLAGELGETGVAELVTLAPARSSQWSTRVIATTRTFRQVPIRERVLLVLPVGRSPPRGTILRASVRVAEPRPEHDGFDERAWLARQGIHMVLDASSWRAIGRRGGLAGVGDALRDRIESAVDRGTEGVRRAIVLGVVLGEDEGLPAAAQDDFRASGLYHLLAVSGQNVAFLAGGVYAIGWLLRLPRAGRELSIVVVVTVYVLAVGWQPSVVRAGVAGVLVSLAWLLARPTDRWHCLAIGALVLTAWMPTAVLEPGFQLSFAAVAAIFVAVPRLRRSLAGYPVPGVVSDALAVALACSVVTSPIVLFHFGEAPAYTVLANVVAFPAAPLVLGLGLLAAVVDPVSPAAAAGLASLAGWAAAWLELVAAVVADLPGAQLRTGRTIGVGLALAAAVIAVRTAGRWLPRRHRAPLAVALGGLLLLAATAWATGGGPSREPPTGLRVTFLDVGQGDSILLETPRARVLVDQGPPEGDVAQQLGAMGIGSLSAVVLTHPQRDHVGGAADVIRGLEVGQVLEPGLEATGPEQEAALRAAGSRGVPVHIVRAGATFRAGGLRLRALWPADEGTSFEDPNRNAVVLVATYGTTDVLLTADAESDVMARLALPEVEVLKVAHHGSEDPGLAKELRELRPRVAVISCGRDNEYGHPRRETLAALGSWPGLALYRTDEDGRVVVESDGTRTLEVETAR
jgi:competence protein ComEC